MKAVFDERQRRHDPKHFMANGAVSQNPEQPKRIEVLHAAALEAGAGFEAPQDHGAGPIAAIHTAEYLEFLETIHARWRRIEGASEEVIPNVHPDRRGASYPRSAVGQAGYHQADTACPIASGTWEAAYWSAQAAVTGADLLTEGARAAYALSRPPGHHAFGDLAGGFCFLNNAAIAAEQLRTWGMRPAILDVDVHHGNGTQGILPLLLGSRAGARYRARHRRQPEPAAAARHGRRRLSGNARPRAFPHRGLRRGCGRGGTGP
jgi:acetoin utilization deacetylase AcuC-like enzyme